MMNKIPKYLSWRIDWYHRDGYQAPSQYLDVENTVWAKKEVREFAHNQRLADFPKVWSYKLVKLFEPEEAIYLKRHSKAR